MSPLETLIQELRGLLEQLARPALAPDPERPAPRARVEAVDRLLEERVLAGLRSGLAEAPGADVVEAVQARVAGAAGAVGALWAALGDAGRATSRLSQAADLAPTGALKERLEAGAKEPRAWARLQHGHALAAQGKGWRASRAWRRVAREAREPALARAAREALDGPRPVTSAPTLFTLNTLGVGLFGKRDVREDGSYVATWCVCALFAPVFPLRAYRVQREGNGWRFLSRERLSPFARGVQGVVAAGALGAAAFVGVQAHLTSPGRLAGVALAEARALEAGGETAKARARLLDAVGHAEGRTGAGAEAGRDFLRLALAETDGRCTPEDVRARRLLTRWGQLPAGARPADGAAQVVARAEACAEALGVADARAAEAVLELVEAAGDQQGLGRPSGALAARAAAAHRTLAAAAAPAEPSRALEHLLAAGDAEALDAARALILSFGEAPSRWAEEGARVEAWAGHAAKVPALAAHAATVTARLASMREEAARLRALADGEDEAALRAAHAHWPKDPGLAAAVAGRLRRDGESARALALLAPLGPSGHLTAQARLMRGLLQSDLEQLPEADATLSGLLAERLEPFRAAQKAYEAALEAERERLVGLANKGALPAAIEHRLKVAEKERHNDVFWEWANEQLEADPKLSALREGVLRHEAVVPASLVLGTVKLRRAQGVQGEARQALLTEAEKVFLAIRAEAGGSTAFHMGLGRVYHRLGRAEEGDRELGKLLERKEPGLTLAVAETYRELFLTPQARRISQGLYDTSDDADAKKGAASLMAHMSLTPDEEETWLRRADTSQPQVRQNLDELVAQRHLREGRFAEADALLAKVASERERRAKHDATSANNAALTYRGRFQATGDAGHLRTAVRLLEGAARQSVDNALVLGNLGGVLRYQGEVGVLEGAVRTRLLHLDSREAGTLLGALLRGSQRPALLASLKSNAAVRRALQLDEQVQVLAPGSAESYAATARWLRWMRDAGGLAALRGRLEALPPFDAEATALRYRDYRSGARDAEYVKLMGAAVEAGRARVERVKAAGHAPTLAAAWLLLGEAQMAQLVLDPAPAALDAAVASYRAAVQAWPGAGFEEDLASGLLYTAYHHARREVPALEEAWKQDGRVYGATQLISRHLSGPHGAALQAALTARPEVREAAALLRARAASPQDLEDVLVARLSGDAALQAQTHAAFARADLGHLLAIEARLAPGEPDEAAALAHFQARGQPAVAADATP
jgi:hypothetical protein